ncbi:MAG: hypothetical protein ACLR23_04015 [Clostridia bacterium]
MFRNIGIVAVNMGKGCAPEVERTAGYVARGDFKRKPPCGRSQRLPMAISAADRCAGFNNSILNCEIYQIGCGGIIWTAAIAGS